MLTPTTTTTTDWDAFVASHSRAHVLQQSAWGELKRRYGWHVERVALTDGSAIVAGAQLLFRRLPLGSMAYLGMGPYVTDDAQWSPLWNAIDQRAKHAGASFLKWEPGILDDALRTIFSQSIKQASFSPFSGPGSSGSRSVFLTGWRRKLRIWDFIPSPQTVQPPRTILIDISADDDAILARMNQGTRRKIRQSQKNGIRYYEGSSADVAVFNQMMQKTGTRSRFGVHEPGYYQLAYDLFVPGGDAALILAEHEGDPLAGIMVFARGKTAWYLYGASSDVKRNLMATYGVQWQAIQWAKARGCTTYDLWGIPDAEPDVLEAEFEQRSDGLWGVYGFKRGWGGEIVRSAGAWDRVYNPLVYGAYRLALRVIGSSPEH